MSYGLIDKSILEGNHPTRIQQSSNIALGRIVDVDIKKRTCTVATITGRDSVFDKYIPECQWLCQDANPEGDESGSIPRRGSLGIVYFVDGQAFIGGYAKPLGDQGTTLRGNEAATLNEGDKIISTLGGNRLTIKISGLIEMYASQGLKRLLIPTGSQIVDLCSTYDLKTAGGLQIWRPSKTLTTLWRAEYFNTTNRLYLIEEKKGFVSSDIIYKRNIGAGTQGVPQGTKLPVYTKTIGLSGETITAIHPPLPEGSPSGYLSTIGPDGSIEILAGAAQTTKINVGSTGAVEVDVNSLGNLMMSDSGDFIFAGPVASASVLKTGDVELANAVGIISMTKEGDITAENAAATLSMAAKGDISISNTTVTITISAAGEVTISAPQKVTIEGKAGVDIKSIGPVNIEGVGPMNIKTKGQIMLDGGTGASDFVLTNPTTLSPFTGAPLVPFSTTVMVSK
jgi:hypothetical protein